MKRLNLKKLPATAVLFTAVLFFAAPAWAQGIYESPANDDTMKEDTGAYAETKTAEGTVTSIDADGGIVTIKPFTATDLNTDQLTIQILPEAKIYKNGAAIKSSDIQINDVVTVEYYDDPSGLKATTVNVE